MCLRSGWIGLLLLALTTVSFADKAEDLRTIRALLSDLRPLPPKTYELGVGSFYRSSLERLREPLEDRLERMDQKPQEVSWLDLGIDYVPIVRAHTSLYEAVFKDLDSLQPDPNRFRLASYVSHDRPLIGADLQLRLDLADALYFETVLGSREVLLSLKSTLDKATTLYWPGYWEFHKQRVSDRGLFALSHGSLRFGDFLERLLNVYQMEVANLEGRYVSLTERAIALSGPEEASALTKEITALRLRGEALKWRLNYALQKIWEVLPTLTQLKRAKSSSVEVLETSLDELAKGYRASLERADVVFNIVIDPESNSQVLFSPCPTPGVWLNNPAEDFVRLFNIKSFDFGFNDPKIPEWASDDPKQILSLYREIVLIQYILAAGTTISHLRRTDEGSASFSQAALTALRLGSLKLASPFVSGGDRSKSELEVAAKVSPLRDDFHNLLPESVRQRRSDLEDALWKRFFIAAGMATENGELPLCAAGLLPPALE